MANEHGHTDVKNKQFALVVITVVSNGVDGNGERCTLVIVVVERTCPYAGAILSSDDTKMLVVAVVEAMDRVILVEKRWKGR